MATRRSSIPAAPVTDTQAAILLGGWSAEPPAGRASGCGDGFIDLVCGDHNLDDLWRMYEPYLRAKAQAWGVTPAHYILPMNQCGLRFVVSGGGEASEGPYYFAEALHLAGPQRVS